MSERTKVFIVDDHPMVRDLLSKYLAMQTDLEVTGTADSAENAFRQMKAAPPDVAVVDLSLKRGSGLSLIKDLRDLLPEIRVVVLSMHEEITDVERAFRAGARGYVMKRESTGQIVEAIRQVRTGRLFAHSETLGLLTSRRIVGRPTQSSGEPADVLSDREMEVFRLLGAGKSTREISDRIGVGFKTIQTYCDRIKGKLGLDDARELIRAAYRWREQEKGG